MCSTNVKSVIFTVKMKHPDNIKVSSTVYQSWVAFLYLRLFKIVARNESIVNSSGYKISFEHQPRFSDRKCNSCKFVVEWLSSKLQHSGNDILKSDDQIVPWRKINTPRTTCRIVLCLSCCSVLLLKVYSLLWSDRFS